MKTLFALAFVILFSWALRGQEGFAAEQNMLELRNFGRASNSTVWLKDERRTDVLGSPFWNDSWASGRLETSSGLIFSEELQLRFDAHSNELHARFPGKQEVVLLNYKINWFEVETPEGVQRFVRLSIPGELPNLFYLQMEEGPRFQLFKLVRKGFKEARKPTDGYSTSVSPAEFFDDHAYFLLDKKSNTFTKLELKRKTLLKALPQYADILEPYIKEHNLRGKLDEQQLRALVQFLERHLTPNRNDREEKRIEP